MQSKVEPFPWDVVMTFGLGVLKLSSAQFWALTPREIASAMSAYAQGASAPPSRMDFENLSAKFPDF